MMKLDVTWELARLTGYVAGVATAIRRNSAYASDYEYRDPKETGLDVMWLADSLHGLDRLGHAIQEGDPKAIVSACDSLLRYYRLFTEGAEGRVIKGNPKSTFERHAHLCQPGEAMSVFEDIRSKALCCVRMD